MFWYITVWIDCSYKLLWVLYYRRKKHTNTSNNPLLRTGADFVSWYSTPANVSVAIQARQQLSRTCYQEFSASQQPLLEQKTFNSVGTSERRGWKKTFSNTRSNSDYTAVGKGSWCKYHCEWDTLWQEKQEVEFESVRETSTSCAKGKNLLVSCLSERKKCDPPKTA